MLIEVDAYTLVYAVINTCMLETTLLYRIQDKYSPQLRGTQQKSAGTYVNSPLIRFYHM